MSTLSESDTSESRPSITPSTNVVLMLSQHRRRWANNKTTLDHRLVFDGLLISSSKSAILNKVMYFDVIFKQKPHYHSGL